MKVKDLLILLAAIFMVSCRKTVNTTPLPTATSFVGCRVSAIQQTFPGLSSGKSTFTYNADGSVATIKSTTVPDNDVFIRTITYKPGCIIVNITDNSLFYGEDSLLTDSANRITYINHYRSSGSMPRNEIYEVYQYYSFGNMATITSYNFNQLSSELFQFKNGDAQWVTAGGDFYNYVYDTANYGAANLSTDINGFQSYGRGILANKHWLSKSYMDSQLAYTYTNVADSTGKIVTITQADVTNTYITTTNVSYECH